MAAAPETGCLPSRPQVRTADIDALERVLDVVAYGDIEAEDTRNLTPLNFIRLFRVAQLTVEYLLFVQDRLAADNCVLKVGAARGRGSMRCGRETVCVARPTQA